MEDLIYKYLEESKSALNSYIQADKKSLIYSVNLMVKAIRQEKKILICGNGGSASDAQHFAAELIGRFKKERIAYPAISLNTDTSAITAIANDYDFSKIFSRQLQGLGQSGDILFAISTSGNSENVIQAAIEAKKKNIEVISLTGSKESKLEKYSTVCIKVSTETTAQIQELHIIVIHLLCTLIETELLKNN